LSVIRSGIIAAGILVNIFWASAALAAPPICKAVVSSPRGGRLVMAKMNSVPASAEFPLALPGGVTSNWYPPTSGDAVTVEIDLNGRTSDDLELADIYVGIDQVKGLEPAQFTALLSAENLPVVKLDGAGVNVVTHQYSLAFQWAHAADSKMAQALASGARVKVEVFKSEKLVEREIFNGTQMNLIVTGLAKPVASVVIDTTDVGARKALFAQGKHLIETSDTAVCKPA
jgi:hypothetical protein